MNCSKCSLEIKNENEQSPVCEECVREFWKQSRFGKGANEWGKRRNPITNKQQRFIATLYQDFKYDNCEFSIRLSHDDFYGHQIEINENILNCKCNSQCELLDKYRDVKKILPSNSAYASRTISFFLKMKKEISKKDIEKLTPKLLNSLWNPRKDNSNLTSSVNNLQSQPKKESWIDRLRKRKNGSRGIHEGSGGEPDNEEDHIEVPIQWPDILNYDISINLQKKRFQSNRFQNANDTGIWMGEITKKHQRRKI